MSVRTPLSRVIFWTAMALALIGGLRTAAAGSETAVVVAVGDASRADQVRKAARAWLEARGSPVVDMKVGASDEARLAQCLVASSKTCADAIALTGADRLWLFQLEPKQQSQGVDLNIALLVFAADGKRLASDDRYCDRCRPETLTAQVENVLTVVADAALARLSARTVIRVRTSPAGALVTIDGRQVGTAAPEFEYRVNPGEHEVAVALARHQPATRRVHLSDGEEKVVELRLVPQASGGTDPPPVSGRSLLWPVTVGGVGLATLSTGITLLVIHDPGEAEGRQNYEKRDRLVPGIILTATGAVVSGVAVYLFVRSRRQQDARVVPTASVSGREFSLGAMGRF